MTTRRVSLLVGLLCLIASTSVAAALPSSLFDGKISGVEWCWQDQCKFAGFSGTYNGKVYGEHDTGLFSAIVTHELPLPTVPGDWVTINEGGYWLIWTSLGYFEGTVTEGSTLTATKNVNRFDVTVMLLLTNPGGTAKFVGVLDHGGLLKQPIEPPTIRGDVVSCESGC